MNVRFPLIEILPPGERRKAHDSGSVIKLQNLEGSESREGHKAPPQVWTYSGRGLHAGSPKGAAWDGPSGAAAAS